MSYLLEAFAFLLLQRFIALYGGTFSIAFPISLACFFISKCIVGILVIISKRVSILMIRIHVQLYATAKASPMSHYRGVFYSRLQKGTVKIVPRTLVQSFWHALMQCCACLLV